MSYRSWASERRIALPVVDETRTQTHTRPNNSQKSLNRNHPTQRILLASEHSLFTLFLALLSAQPNRRTSPPSRISISISRINLTSIEDNAADNARSPTSLQQDIPVTLRDPEERARHDTAFIRNGPGPLGSVHTYGTCAVLHLLLRVEYFALCCGTNQLFLLTDCIYNKLPIPQPTHLLFPSFSPSLPHPSIPLGIVRMELELHGKKIASAPRPAPGRRKRTQSRPHKAHRHPAGEPEPEPTPRPPPASASPLLSGGVAHQMRFSSAIHRAPSGRPVALDVDVDDAHLTATTAELDGPPPRLSKHEEVKEEHRRRDALPTSTSCFPSAGPTRRPSRPGVPLSPIGHPPLRSAAVARSSGGPADVVRGNSTRVSRLLRDSRAAARNPFRPETPAEYTKQPLFPNSRKGAAAPGGVRLTPIQLPPANGSAMEVEPSALVSSVVQLDPDAFLPAFKQADGNAEKQTAMLRQLMCWLANPAHQIWPELRAHFMFLLRRVHQSRLAYQAALWEYGNNNSYGSFSSSRGGATGEGANPPGVPPPEDPSVAMVIVSVVFHNTADIVSEPFALMDMVALLRTLAEEGMASWLESELIFDPLLSIVADERTLDHPELLSGVLAIVQECTTSIAPVPRKHRSGDEAPTANGACSATAESTQTAAEMEAAAAAAETAAITSQLVTLGVIPKVTGVSRRLLAAAEERIMERQCEDADGAGASTAGSEAGGSRREGEGDGADVSLSLDWIEEMMERVCLIYRNLGVHFSHHLQRLGTLDILTLTLCILKHSTTVVEAAARAVAKLVFDDGCLRDLAGNLNFMRAALQAMMAQLSLNSKPGKPTQNGDDDDAGCGELDQLGLLLQDSPRIHLLVARLSGAMARVAEQSEDQRDLLALHGGPLALTLLQRFVRVETLATAAFTAAPFAIAGRSPMKRQKRQLGAEADVEEEEEDEDTPSLTTGGAAGAPGDPTDLPLMQAIVWLVGVMGMSAHCDTAVVLEGVPILTQLLQDVALTPQTRPTVLYALMAMSNLSFFFGAIEDRYHDDDDVDEAQEEGKDEDEGSRSAKRDREQSRRDNERLIAMYEPLGMTVAGVLFAGDVEAAVEATRILSNMCYTIAGADWVEMNKCDEVLVLFMGHEDLRIVYNSTGALLNLTAGTSCRVVEDQSLLQMLLQYTGRFTSQTSVEEAASEEKKLLLQQRHALPQPGSNASAPRILTEAEAAEEAEQLAGSYAEQIAAVVDRLLQNIKGLLEHQQQERDAI
eukprot:gene11910-8192_t